MASIVAEFDPDRACPCCGRTLPLGVFTRPAIVKQPLAVKLASEHGERMVEHAGVIEIAGRTFLAADASLPLVWPESPVQISTWIECDARYRDKLTTAREGKGEAWYGNGWLAADVPGFPGSIGSSVYFSVTPGQITPRLRRVDDTRIAGLGRLNHEQLIGLYRQVWGNRDSVVDADLVLRGLVYQAWSDRIGREIYRQPIAPPPPVSGIVPAELLIAPPRDTGDEAALATLGCAEAARTPEHAAELITWVRDPGPEFIRSFAEFCYLTRMSRPRLAHGAVISERVAIPQSNEMSSWLLARPWWEGETWSEIPYQQQTIQLLAAIPLCPAEKAFAERRGSRELLRALEAANADFADLQRPSCLLI
jgi:hypothetical protein